MFYKIIISSFFLQLKQLELHSLSHTAILWIMSSRTRKPSLSNVEHSIPIPNWHTHNYVLTHSSNCVNSPIRTTIWTDDPPPARTTPMHSHSSPFYLLWITSVQPVAPCISSHPWRRSCVGILCSSHVVVSYADSRPFNPKHPLHFQNVISCQLENYSQPNSEIGSLREYNKQTKNLTLRILV